ncbi:MAG: hypothetical protein OEM40_08630, partial [Acidimicrobiia bacterium]|nr:hypothetical protein [Acidimicrobiia bacterium]
AGVLRAPRGGRLPLKQRVTAVGVVIATFLSANVGLAAAAQNAAPGDALYGVDRAYERIAAFVGISNPRAEERLQEANVLAERGDASAALAAASAALDALSSSLEDPGSGADDQSAASIREASSELVQAIPQNGNSRPEFVNDMMAETRMIVQLAQEMREAAANGDAAEAAKKLKDQAKKIAERAKQEKASNADKDKPKNNSGNSTP